MLLAIIKNSPAQNDFFIGCLTSVLGLPKLGLIEINAAELEQV